MATLQKACIIHNMVNSPERQHVLLVIEEQQHSQSGWRDLRDMFGVTSWEDPCRTIEVM